MVSGVVDGIPMDESVVRWVRRVTKGNQTTISAGPQVLMEFDFTCDPSAVPMTIDYRHTAGPSCSGSSFNPVSSYSSRAAPSSMVSPSSSPPPGVNQ